MIRYRYRYMIIGFRDRGTEDLFDGKDTRAARRTLPVALWIVAARKLALLNGAEALVDVRMPSGNRLEALRGNRSGQYSIRINERYRICFRWTPGGPADVEVTNYH
jgi:toxin HigB-1